jgi:hypothetical protein
MPDERKPQLDPLTVDLDSIESPALRRIIEEVRADVADLREEVRHPRRYDRIHNRHNR